MCGITGVLYSDTQRIADRQVLQAMGDAIAHRGPDGEGFFRAANVGLVHRRLAIIDLTGGNQPISNEDESVQVVFNGEIYNFRELQRTLRSRGHQLRTNSDTEVLVHLYEDHGPQLVRHLRGMFAFAVWDARRQQLLLARDRVGLKPLYYYRDAEKLAFASEIKAIRAVPGLKLDLDVQAVEDFLTYGFIPGERSIFRQIRKLPPGHILSVSRDNLQSSPERYWKLTAEPDNSRSAEDWLEALSAKFTETVDLHRIADVPVGAFLSGGMDSGGIVSELTTNGRPLQTFSIGFNEERFSELPYARAIAQHFGTTHTEEIVTPDAVQSLDQLLHFYDEPFADSSAVPTMHVSRLARKSVKVVLSGDGGDEAFGGYHRYAHDVKEARLRGMIPPCIRRSVLRQAARIWPQTDFLPRVLRAKSTLTNLASDPAAAYANTMSLCRQPLRRQLLSGDVRKMLNGYRPEAAVEGAFPQSGDALKQMTECDVNFVLPDDFLTKVDRAGMSVGLEVRPPLVDHEFLELAAGIPSRWKIRDGQSKWIFRQLVEKRLPDGILNRPKQGFEIPVDQWLKTSLRPQ
ncbi:MAG: asparagine synthase (glutamine-hydrolyzing), partial [Planctomycetaceae bacterium]|nr:asparagine synthase (glutamine-hydrolyzing) [Planctomycetaceae bacterium]